MIAIAIAIAIALGGHMRPWRVWEVKKTFRRGSSIVLVAHPGSIHRFHLSYEWYSDDEYLVALSWGEEGSDPVWLIETSLKLPDWINRRLPGYVPPDQCRSSPPDELMASADDPVAS